MVSLNSRDMTCQDEDVWNSDVDGNDVILSDQAPKQKQLGCSFSPLLRNGNVTDFRFVYMIDAYFFRICMYITCIYMYMYYDTIRLG